MEFMSANTLKKQLDKRSVNIDFECRQTNTCMSKNFEDAEIVLDGNMMFIHDKDRYNMGIDLYEIEIINKADNGFCILTKDMNININLI